MSAAKTAAAIGLTITADEKQATKALAALNASMGGLQTKSAGLASYLSDLTVDGLEKLTFGLGRAAVSTAKWGVGLGALSATAAAVGLVDMARNFATGASAMGRSADMLGIPVTKLSEFGIAAHLAGSSAEAMQAGIAGLQDTVSKAAFGGDNMAFSEFRQMGIDVGDAKRGAAKDYLAMLPKIADETERLAKVNVHAAEHMLDVIGVGHELFPVLRHGSAGLSARLNQAADMNPTTDADVARAQALDFTIRGLEERFAGFGREAGAAAAPGLTHVLDELQKFLTEHKGDVAEFFGEVEQGIEWLATPKNLSWLHEEVDKIIGGFKEAGHLVEELDHSVVFRRLLGLPVDQSEVTQDHAAQRSGMPMEGEDDPAGRLGGSLPGGPTFFSRAFDWLTGNGRPSGAVNGSTQAGMKQLIAMGWQPGDAAGLLGNAQQESSLNPQAGAGTAHQGLFQWDDERRRAIEAHFSKPLMQMSFAEQLAAANWELREGKFKGVGDQLQSGSHEAGRSAAIVDRYYEMPANPGSLQLLQEDAKRAANARLAMRGFDSGAQRMAQDAQASPPSATSPPSTDAADRLAKLKVEVHHINAPHGSSVRVTSDSPGYIDIDPPRTMGAMPDSGQQRNVVKDGY